MQLIALSRHLILKNNKKWHPYTYMEVRFSYRRAAEHFTEKKVIDDNKK